MKYIKLFELHSDYETYMSTTNKFLPNLSHCLDVPDNHLTPWSGIVAKFNVTDISTTTILTGATSSINRMEVDGITLNAPVSTYQFQDTGIHIVKYELKNPALLPNSMFYNCTNVIDITIPETITSIKTSNSYGSFNGCTNLQHVLFKEGGLTSLHSGGYITSPTSTNGYTVSTRLDFCLFYNCTSLTSIGPIGSGASIEIPESVTIISGIMFYGCTNLTTITIPKNVTSIDARVFYGCSGLTEINVEEGNTTYRTDENHKILLSDNSVVLGLDNAIIPEDNNIIYISSCAFSNRTFDNSINIPSNIISIDHQAFENVTTSSIICPNTISTIDYCAFRYCKASSIKLPNSITSISIRCFEGCPNLLSLGPIGSGASLELNSSIKSLGYYAFYNNYFTSIKIPYITTYNYSNFAGSNNITSVGPKSSNADFIWPSSMTVISLLAFYLFKNLTTVEIPNGVTIINLEAFNNCQKLTTVIIPSSVTTIGNKVFNLQYGNLYNNNITITINNTTPPSIASDTFSSSSSYKNKITIYVPEESVNTYKNATYWSVMDTRIFAIE